MTLMRKIILTVAASAFALTSVTPAFAGWGGYGYSKYKYGRYHKRRGLDTGDVIGILAIGAFVAAVATSGKSKRRARDQGIDDRDYERGPYRRGAINSETDAVDACAQAAEDRAGQRSNVRDITKVSVADDGWDIAGTIETREDWRDKRTVPSDFTCVVRDGTIRGVFVDSPTVAER